jgi:hypothetical protein
MAQSRERIDHAKHARWRQTLLRWESSGLSIRAFCKRERIHESQFWWWRRRLGGRPKTSTTSSSPIVSSPSAGSDPSSSGPAFVPIAVVSDSPSASSAIDIRLASGHRLRVRAGCDCRLLAEVVAVLQARPETEGRPC